LNDQIVRQSEAHDRLGWNFDIAISRQAAQCCSTTCADEATDKQTNSPSGHATDQHAKSGAAADDRSRSLSFTPFGPRQISRIEGVARAV
jgi:hypothetical protein